MHIIEVHVEDN